MPIHWPLSIPKAIIASLFKVVGQDIELEVVSTKSERNNLALISESMWISEEEKNHMIDSISNFAASRAENKHASPHDYSYMRDIIELDFYTGMRRGELFAMKRKWIEDDFRIIKIGDKDFIESVNQTLSK